jgi:crossover junction endodeoxyribonuclease RusA
MSDWMLCLPYPPSVNGYWRVFRGRQILSKRAREYRASVVELVTQQWGPGSLVEASARLKVAFEVYPPTKRRIDLDNLPKGMLDALTHAGVWGDDSQIDDLRITRQACEGKPGHVVFTMREL